MSDERAKNHSYLTFLKEMRMLATLAFVVALCAFALSVTLVGLAFSYLEGKQIEIGLILGLASTIGGIVTTCIAYLAPSPLQQMASRRSDSGVMPAGTPKDPVSTQEVKPNADQKDETSGAVEGDSSGELEALENKDLKD